MQNSGVGSKPCRHGGGGFRAEGHEGPVAPGRHEEDHAVLLAGGGAAHAAHHSVPPLRQLLRSLPVRGVFFAVAVVVVVVAEEARTELEVGIKSPTSALSGKRDGEHEVAVAVVAVVRLVHVDVEAFSGE